MESLILLANELLRSFVPDPVRRLYRDWFPHIAPNYADLWEKHCAKWVLGNIQSVDGWIHGTGWVILNKADQSQLQIRLNDQPVEKLVYPVSRPDVANQLYFLKDAESSGFDFWYRVENLSQGISDLLITLHRASDGSALGHDYPAAMIPSSQRFGLAPKPKHMARVIGAPSDFYFKMGGWTTFNTLKQAVQVATGKELTDFPRVLDWGCGCGRVARYFLPLPGVKLTGVDIDPETVGWCRAYLTEGVWNAIPLRPPTTMADASFDLAYGISVFTHLKEREQKAWLAELRRIIRPGGIALMTFHGLASIVWSGLSAERYAYLQRYGICDQANPLYDADVGESDYYRDTFHTLDYIRRVWGSYFEILNVMPSSVSHQDLVVMQRR